MNTKLQSAERSEISIEKTQFVITNHRDINLRFAQKIIDWYFYRNSLNWETFLEAKRIAQVTNDTSFISKVFQVRPDYSLTAVESRCS
jgi:hypothetical protein